MKSIFSRFMAGDSRPSWGNKAWAPIAAWSIVGICVAATVYTTFTVATEHYIRQRIAEGIAAALRGSVAQINASPPQASVALHSRNLQPYQMKILLQELPNLHPLLKSVAIGTTPTDTASFGLYGELTRIFEINGIMPTPVFVSSHSSSDDDLLIWVDDVENIPDAAEQLREVFERAGIHPTIASGPPGFAANGRDFVVFIPPHSS